MKFVCEFNMDNDAFMDYDEYDPAEAVRILREIATKIKDGMDSGSILDINGGCKIGKWEIVS
jgi:hypothetical protein